MNERSLYTYAMAKSLYDNRNGDILDILVPFVVLIVKNEGPEAGITQFEIRKELRKNYNLKMPLYVLKSIITRAKRSNYLKQKSKKVYLAKEANLVLKTIDTERKIDRKNNEFILGLQEYLGENNIELSFSKTADKLNQVVNNNLNTLTTYLGEFPDTNKTGIKEKEAKYILKYFEYVEKNNSSQFETLKNIIMGSIICTLVKKDHNELKSKIEPAKIFLDTNVIFNIFGYHADELARPCKELMEILRKHNFEFYIFDFTLQEIRNVLNKYKLYYNRILSDFRDNSLFNKLKSEGLTPFDIREIVGKLENLLLDKDINIYTTEKELSKDEDKELDYSNIAHYKDSDIATYNHDLWAIEYIKELRNKRVTKLEKAKALFLTCDLNLVKFNFCVGGHKDDGTLNEVISTFTLSNILWFKDPGVNNDLPLNSAISIHANSLFLDNEFWNDFYNKLELMKEQEIIDEEDISYLAYNTSLENTLADLNDNQNEIKEDQIIKIIEDSRQRYKDKEVEIAAEAKEKDKIKAENRRLNEKVDKINKKLTTKAAQNARRKSSNIKRVVFIFLSLSSVASFYFTYEKDFLAKIYSAIPGILAAYTFFENKFEQRLLNYFREKEMKKLEFTFKENREETERPIFKREEKSA
ncbi:MAG: hypothetical protein ACOCV1_08435 [Bacillota bacterium]